MPHRLVVPQKVISNEIAQLYKVRIGRGPTRVSTTIAGNLVSCVLESTRTLQEGTMSDAGADELVLRARRHFQLHFGEQMIAIVQRATGRTVTAHVPGYNQRIDVAVETFLLRDGDDAAAAEDELLLPLATGPPTDAS